MSQSLEVIKVSRVIFENLKSIEKLIKGTNALHKSHYRLKSGLHSDGYLDKSALYTYPADFWDEVVCEIQDYLDYESINIDVVLGAEKGGVIFSSMVALALGLSRDYPVAAICAYKRGKGLFLTQQQAEFLENKRVLIIDDVVTTGSTLRMLSRLAKSHKALVEAATLICLRGDESALYLPEDYSIFVPYHLPLKQWDKDVCPLCRQGIPVDRRPGH